MSQDAIELARQGLRAIFEGNEDRAAEILAPETEWHNTSVFPGESVCVGPTRILSFWSQLIEPFAEEGGTEIVALTLVGDHVVAELRSRGHGRGSGIPLDVEWATAIELRAGRISRIDVYGSGENAVRALRAAP